MAKFHCFPALLVGKKKKNKESAKAMNGVRKGTSQVKQEKLVEPYDEKGIKEMTFDVVVPFGSHETSPNSKPKVSVNDCLDEVEEAYEGGDEHDEILSMKRDFSDFDLQAKLENQRDLASDEPEINNRSSKIKLEEDDGAGEVTVQSGHLSDPGIGQTTDFWGSPTLKRSCSNIGRRITARPPVSPSKSVSYDDLRNVTSTSRGEFSLGIKNSPLSVMSSCSADKVMLKKRSSSQVLPSRSRKLWWRLFMRSHRNSHKSWMSKPRRPFSINDSSNQRGGYCSDTLEPNHSSSMQLNKGKEIAENIDKNGIWLQNQWVAFSMETSPLGRVDAWVNTLEDNIFNPVDDDEDGEELQREDIAFLTSHEIGESSGKSYNKTGRHFEEVLQANNIVQSLNSLSSGAHISGMGLKVIPVISSFSNLRSVNLSNNFIVHITPGALPKSLHTLDLSRNKITTTDGLRELTRLRVLNLNYNKISRISHGLSNSTLIKELYLAGNKISNVEGLHRLLKLTVLDLSFNKITTAKSLGQLVANYSSLLALNLLGNPVHNNIGDDQLRKAVLGLLPQLTYLNKQPIKPQRAREAATDSVAKAALGNNGWSSRKRVVRRVSQGLLEGSGHRGHSGSRHRSKSRLRHSPSRKR